MSNPKHQAPNDASALAALNEWIAKPEAERLEFKEAKNNFHVERLAKYCAALSNEGGGTIILGVTDRRPRRVVGTAAFEEPGRTVAGLCDRLRIRVTADEIHHPDGRVLAFHAPQGQSACRFSSKEFTGEEPAMNFALLPPTSFVAFLMKPDPIFRRS